MAEYIEREALVDVLAVSHAHHANNSREAALLDRDIRLIWEQPAADVVPVVHAEWIVCGDGDNVPWMCSHCGKTTAHKYKTMYGNYCPNCGARMDGDGKE